MSYMPEKAVAIIVCAWPPEGGGIGNNAYYHAKLLAEANNQVTAYTPAYRDINLQSHPWLRALPVILQNGKAGFMVGLWQELQSQQIVHLYLPFFGTDLIVYLWALMDHSRKLILHYQMDAVGQGWRKVIFKIYSWLFLPLVLHRANTIIALSKDHAQHSYLADYYKKHSEKFAFIPNGIDTERFHPQGKDTDMQRRLGIAPGDRVIMFAAGLDRQHYFKGLARLLSVYADIVHKYPATKLLIVGDGGQRSMYEQISHELNIADRVVFTGWIANNDLHRYYALADMFVLPSEARTESFGIVIAEAQACGVPAIVSDWPGSRQTIEDGVTGLVIPPSDSPGLFAAIEKLLIDNTAREAMGRAAHGRASRLYNWQSVMAQINSVYKIYQA